MVRAVLRLEVEVMLFLRMHTKEKCQNIGHVFQVESIPLLLPFEVAKHVLNQLEREYNSICVHKH